MKNGAPIQVLNPHLTPKNQYKILRIVFDTYNVHKMLNFNKLRN